MEKIQKVIEWFDNISEKRKHTLISFDIVNFYPSSYDSAEVCELVGLFILKHLGEKFGKENIGLYRNDGLAIVKNKTARLADKIRRELHKISNDLASKLRHKRI